MDHNGEYDEHYDLNAPPRFVLSQETINAALARADSSSSSSMSHRPTHPDSRTSSHSKSSCNHPTNCGCHKCYQNSGLRGTQVRTTKNAAGDRVDEFDGDERDNRLGLHGVPDEDEPRFAKPTRRETERSNSSRTPSRADSGNMNIYQGINKNGDRVEEYAGSKGPAVRAHYDWDAPENQIMFGEKPGMRRSETTRY